MLLTVAILAVIALVVAAPADEGVDGMVSHRRRKLGARMAKGKAKIPSTTGYQYYLTWNPDPDGMKLIFC